MLLSLRMDGLQRFPAASEFPLNAETISYSLRGAQASTRASGGTSFLQFVRQTGRIGLVRGPLLRLRTYSVLAYISLCVWVSMVLATNRYVWGGKRGVVLTVCISGRVKYRRTELWCPGPQHAKTVYTRQGAAVCRADKL